MRACNLPAAGSCGCAAAASVALAAAEWFWASALIPRCGLRSDVAIAGAASKVGRAWVSWETNRGRRRRALVRVVRVEVLRLGEPVEEEGALEPHLHDGAVDALLAQAGGIVGFLDLVEATLELDALLVVGLFHRGGKRRAARSCELLSVFER